jgi:autotransporter-associated beta strand protein
LTGGGTLSATNALSLGAVRVAALTVPNGTTLVTNAALNYPGFSTSIAGTGVSSAGALNFTSASAVDLGAITLTADATIRSTVNGASLASSISNVLFLLTVSMPTAASTFTLSGLISGSGGLTLSASSNDRTLALTNLANNFSGPVSITGKINAYQLADAGVASSIGAATGSNATIKLGSGTTVGELLYAGSGTVSTNRVLDFAGTTATAAISTGVAGGRVTYTAPAFTATGAGAKAFSIFAIGSSFITIQSVIPDSSGGATRLVNGSGGGTVTLSGLNTFTGTVAWTGGTLSVNTIKNVGGGSSALGAPTTVANGTLSLGGTSTATLVYTGTGDTTDRVISLNGTTTGGATITNNGLDALVFTSSIAGVSASGTRTFTLSGTNTNTNDFQGVIANVGGGAGVTAFTKAGAGYWKLSGANTFTGAFSMTAGTLDAANVTALGADASTGSISSASLVINAALAYGTRSLTVSGTGVSTSGAVIHAYAGTASIGPVTLGSGGAYVRGTATGAFASSIVTASGRNLTVGAASGQTFTLSGIITGDGSLVFGNYASDTGVVRLTQANTVGNTTLTRGTLQAGNTQALGTTGTVTIAAGTTLQSLTAGGQNGKLTVGGNFDNSAGGVIRIGG